MKIIKLLTFNQRDATEVLTQMIDMELETIVVVGLDKEGSVLLVKSATG